MRWKPGKALTHLGKRKTLGHLPADSSLKDYERLIKSLILDDENPVYLYRFGEERYYAVRGNVQNAEWLVITSRKGILETAFPPDDIDDYLKKRGFLFIGTAREVLA